MGVNSRFVIGSILTLILAASSAAEPRITAPTRGGPFPSEPILILEPFGRGGGPDLLAHALADELTNALHQPVTVENVTGNGATAAPRKAAQLPPDGYTLLISTNAQAYTKAARLDLDYDPLRDFIPVSTLTKQPYVLVTGKPTGIHSLAELLRASKASHGALTFGSTGIGTGTHIAAEQLNLEAGLHARHVPPGPTDANSDVLANAASGKFTFYFAPINLALPAIRSGDLVPLGVSTKSRSPLLPNVPAISEGGVRQFDFPLWYGIWVRSGTPDARIAKLNRALAQAMRKASMRAWLRAHGAEPFILSQGPFRRLVRGDCHQASIILKSDRC